MEILCIYQPIRWNICFGNNINLSVYKRKELPCFLNTWYILLLYYFKFHFTRTYWIWVGVKTWNGSKQLHPILYSCCCSMCRIYLVRKNESNKRKRAHITRRSVIRELIGAAKRQPFLYAPIFCIPMKTHLQIV